MRGRVRLWRWLLDGEEEARRETHTEEEVAATKCPLILNSWSTEKLVDHPLENRHVEAYLLRPP